MLSLHHDFFSLSLYLCIDQVSVINSKTRTRELHSNLRIQMNVSRFIAVFNLFKTKID